MSQEPMKARGTCRCPSKARQHSPCHKACHAWLVLNCLQVGPELEVPGYGCEDHLFELDTVAHSWEVVAVGSSTESTDISMN